MRKLLLALGAVALSSTAQATSLKDFWQSREPDAPHFESTKTMASLEMCLGLEMSETGGPPSIIDGDGEMLMTGLAYGLYGISNPVYGYHITDHGTSRSITVGALHTGGWRDRASVLAQRCI